MYFTLIIHNILQCNFVQIQLPGDRVGVKATILVVAIHHLCLLKSFHQKVTHLLL